VAARPDVRDAGLVIDKTLADRLVHPLHERGLTFPMPGLARAEACGLSGMAMIA
jgi:hypothetical protein